MPDSPVVENIQYTLTIFNPDGSVYWREYANSPERLNAWLATEKTRPYWNEAFTYEISP